MMRALAIALAVLALSTGQADPQVPPDDQADTNVLRPSFARNAGPLVAVDSGHHNYHTIDNRYGPFAALLRNDGFRVVDSKTPFTADSLAMSKVLVIANAFPVDDGVPPPEPTPAAFSPTEVSAVKAFVERGGSLLLITDHMPYAGAVSELALAFGFRLQDGAALRQPPIGPPTNRKPDIFTKADGTLADDVVTRGRNKDESVTALATFVGTAFEGPADARPIIVLPEGYSIYECGPPCPGGAPKQHDAKGYWQGALRVVGQGRVAVFGEAAMFSAQVIPSFTPPFRFGFNAPGAEQNKQFILNLMHWLTGVLPE